VLLGRLVGPVSLTVTHAGVEVRADWREGYDQVLTAEALTLLARLQREFGPRRTELLALRDAAERAAVALPDPARLAVLDGQGKEVAEYPLTVPDADLRGNPPGGLADVTQTTTDVYWFTGSATLALDTADLRPRWTRAGSLGTGSEVAGRLLLPVPGALAVLDTITGKQLGALPVDRGGYRGPVGTASFGGVVLEQRGDTLVALR